MFCGYDVHPAANLFPMMTAEESDDLRDDIKAHGLIHPIILIGNQILDGRNRAIECGRLGIVPKVEQWAGVGSPIDWVMSVNLHRRHLSAGQRAAIALESAPLYKDESQARMLAGKKPDPSLVLDEGDSIARAAKAVGVSRASVYHAKKLRDEAPAEFAKVKANEITLESAKKTLYGHEGSTVVPPKDEDPKDKSSEVIWSLNYHWKRATKKEKAEFCQEHGLRTIKPKRK
jgi:hypothetical protein